MGKTKPCSVDYCYQSQKRGPYGQHYNDQDFMERKREGPNRFGDVMYRSQNGPIPRLGTPDIGQNDPWDKMAYLPPKQ